MTLQNLLEIKNLEITSLPPKENEFSKEFVDKVMKIKAITLIENGNLVMLKN